MKATEPRARAAPAALSVVAESDDASLAGLPEGVDPPARGGDAAVIALGAAAAGGPTPAVRWLDREPGEADPPGERLIAPAGGGLWRCAPWPAADALFTLAPPTGDRCLLVGSPIRELDRSRPPAAGAEPTGEETVAERALARGVEVDSVDRLDAELLAGAACVILADSPGGALPARAFAVLAAGRLLVTPRLETTFGLEDGLDHLEFGGPDDAVTLVEAYRRVPGAFARIAAWGRLKAGPQRASVAYARLAADLRLDEPGGV